MLECFYYIKVIQIDGVHDVHLAVIGATCDVVTIYAIRDSSDLLLMRLRSCETLSHIQVPYRDRTILVADCCKPVQVCGDRLGFPLLLHGAFKVLPVVGKSDVVHNGVLTGIHDRNGSFGPYIEQ